MSDTIPQTDMDGRPFPPATMGMGPSERDAALEEAARIVEQASDAHDLHAVAARIRERKGKP